MIQKKGIVMFIKKRMVQYFKNVKKTNFFKYFYDSLEMKKKYIVIL